MCAELIDNLLKTNRKFSTLFAFMQRFSVNMAKNGAETVLEAYVCDLADRDIKKDLYCVL